MVTRVFEQCCDIKREDLIRIIKSTPLGADLKNAAAPPSNIVNSATKFLKSLSEQLVVMYCSASEQMANKNLVSGGASTEKEEKEKQML